MAGAYSLVARLVRENKPVALATVVSGAPLGAKIVVPGDPAVGATGSIHLELDGCIVSDARELLDAQRNDTCLYEVSGAQVQIFIETFPPPQRLIIIGAVHVAIPLHRLAKQLGFHVTVVDARGQLATYERFPQADALIEEWPDDALLKLEPDSSTSIVVLTHEPKFDHPALVTALRSPARYIGAIGSRTTNEQRLAALLEDGFSDDVIARIHAPVGLDIGARTPAEIALSVLAEVVAARYGRPGGHLSARQ